jgi:hypothetical protein
MTHIRPTSLAPRSSWRRACALVAVTLAGLCSAAAAEEEVKLTPAQVQNLGIRVARPISSRTDQTLPYPPRS